jgi:hypothetical protein
MTRRQSVVLAAFLGPVLAAGLPFLELMLDCREPTSEACVWGHSLILVSITVSVVFFGTLIAIALFALFEWRRRHTASS